jgi:hypothetical protein
MAASDIFGLAVRLLGLGSLLCGILYLQALLGMHVPSGYGVLDYVIAGFVLIVVGLCCLRGASGIVRFTYHDERSPKDTSARS